MVGHTFFDMGSSQFVTRQGPVFTHLLLADEINRAPAKTQAALLEVMQEGQVTLEGRSIAAPQPFMVLATQNPIEQEGTYPLPEAQLDRFLLKIRIDYPDLDDELALARRVLERRSGGDLAVDEVATVIGPDQVAALQRLAAHVVDDRVLHYAVSISRATREHPRLSMGASPRGDRLGARRPRPRLAVGAKLRRAGRCQVRGPAGIAPSRGDLARSRHRGSERRRTAPGAARSGAFAATLTGLPTCSCPTAPC